MTPPFYTDDYEFLNKLVEEEGKELVEDRDTLKARAGQIDMNNYLLEKPPSQQVLEEIAELLGSLDKGKESKEFWVLYCYRPPSINQKHFSPFRTGVIGIFKTLDDLIKRMEEIKSKNIAEYRGYQLFYAPSKLIESMKDYAWPLGFNEAGFNEAF